MKSAPTIGVVDDEPRFLVALRRLLGSEGFAVRTYASADAFLRRPPDEEVDCLVLDVSLPGLSGLDLQDRLRQGGDRLPVIFLTGRGDIPMTVRALKGGAVNFLTKPVNDADLLAAVRVALADAARIRSEDREKAADSERWSMLTPREQEVFRHVISGRPNKQIAGDLGTSEQTVKVHRMRLSRKLRCASVAELVRTATRLGITPAASG